MKVNVYEGMANDLEEREIVLEVKVNDLWEKGNDLWEREIVLEVKEIDLWVTTEVELRLLSGTAIVFEAKEFDDDHVVNDDEEKVNVEENDEENDGKDGNDRRWTLHVPP